MSPAGPTLEHEQILRSHYFLHGGGADFFRTLSEIARETPGPGGLGWVEL